ncbi:hypothetical protein AAVH_40364, partial [Aphelenchoides avenae]
MSPRLLAKLITIFVLVCFSAAAPAMSTEHSKLTPNGSEIVATQFCVLWLGCLWDYCDAYCRARNFDMGGCHGG